MCHEELLDRSVAPIKEYGNVVVSCGPGIGEQPTCLFCKEALQIVAKTINGLSEGDPPALTPARLAAGAAPAIFLPPPQTMGTAPRASISNDDLMCGGRAREIGPEVGDREFFRRSLFCQ